MAAILRIVNDWSLMLERSTQQKEDYSNHQKPALISNFVAQHKVYEKEPDFHNGSLVYYA